jgi:hypothetical protein
MENEQLLQSITFSTKELMDQHHKLALQLKTIKSQLDTQQKDIQHLTVDKESLIKENSELKKNIKLAQSLTAGSGDQSSRQVKTKINEYIREIDKCLSLLNRE